MSSTYIPNSKDKWIPNSLVTGDSQPPLFPTYSV